MKLLVVAMACGAAAGIIILIMAGNTATPSSSSLSISGLEIWEQTTRWFCGPHICLLLNLIILFIAAASCYASDHPTPPFSKFLSDVNYHHHHLHDPAHDDDDDGTIITAPASTDGEINLDGDEGNKGDDTLDETWKAINHVDIGESRGEGRSDRPTRQDLLPQRLEPTSTMGVGKKRVDAMATWRELRKSETFNDAVTLRRRGGLRRGPSLTLDDLNRRIDAFINNFTHQIRLQRQESRQRFLDMINGDGGVN
ncbi:hypothetical protein NMG60_11024062 [Bertholletia excelsa]